MVAIRSGENLSPDLKYICYDINNHLGKALRLLSLREDWKLDGSADINLDRYAKVKGT